ncbi:hypothetical protein RZS08_41705, partial [Arthrospira platensis SPKY1]|nr:hypothetical protein [Arthrospira platensis SPKY1]
MLILPVILRKANVITRTLGWLLLVPAILAATALWTQRPDPRLALVVGEKITLRVAPTTASPGIKELVPGTHVRVLNKERDFR